MRAPFLVLTLLALVAPSAASAAARPTTAQTLAAARALGVGDDAAKLQGRFLPGARLVPAKAGRSHLGGAPDLPRGTAWPTCHRGHRLTLLAQIDLQDLARAVPGATRARGTLAVFASMVVDPQTGFPEIDPWSGWLRPGACYQVRHFPRTARLAHRATPHGTKAFRSVPVRLRPTLTMPDWETAETLLGGRRADPWFDHWRDLVERAGWGDLTHTAPFAPRWQALGWSSPLQQDPTTKYGCVSAHQPKGPKRLLLQLDADEDRLDFDDTTGGQLGITITAADLRAGRFDRLCGEYQFD